MRGQCCTRYATSQTHRRFGFLVFDAWHSWAHVFVGIPCFIDVISLFVLLLSLARRLYWNCRMLGWSSCWWNIVNPVFWLDVETLVAEPFALGSVQIRTWHNLYTRCCPFYFLDTSSCGIVVFECSYHMLSILISIAVVFILVVFYQTRGIMCIILFVVCVVCVFAVALTLVGLYDCRQCLLVLLMLVVLHC